MENWLRKKIVSTIAQMKNTDKKVFPIAKLRELARMKLN